METQTLNLEKIDENRYRIPKDWKPGMRTDGIIYANEKLLKDILNDKAAEQVANVAFLPGIVGSSLAMPDIHWGYGFPIGGVAATDTEKSGVVSPGGVGFDINCGVRLIRTELDKKAVSDKLERLVNELFHTVPAGLGSKSGFKLTASGQRKMMKQGAAWAVENGMGVFDDLENTEENGRLESANPDVVSSKAWDRGKNQAGTLGSGNHFLEIQEVDKIFDEQTARDWGLFKGQITLMIHTGSRGFGHQICSDYAKIMLNCLRKYDIQVPDRQLACAPVNSPEARDYFGAMACAANYAWCNRQVLMDLARKAFEKIFKASWSGLGVRLVYDVAHNIAKLEDHVVNGKRLKLCVHRKGATRAFGPGSPDLPEHYQKIGQPVIIPGDMGRNSYLLAGTETAMRETFGSTCHGAGRLMSRSQATRSLNSKMVLAELKAKGIIVRSSGRETISEEAPQAYKDVNEVVGVVAQAGLSRKICRMRPLGVVKG